MKRMKTKWGRRGAKLSREQIAVLEVEEERKRDEKTIQNEARRALDAAK